MRTLLDPSEVAVTLSADLYDHLATESRRLSVPLEWLVASIVADTMEDEEQPEAETELLGMAMA